MEPVVWDKRLATGDPHIDAQHEELHDLVLELGLMADEREEDRVRLGEVLFDVIAYASTHFSDEEALMERIGFPGLDRQKRLHAEFRTALAAMSDRFAEGDPTLNAAAMQTWLQDWLLHHVWEEDLQFAAYVRPQGN